MKKIVLICFLLCGCGLYDSNDPPPSEPGDDARLQEAYKYYEEFYDRANFYLQSGLIIAIVPVSVEIPIYMDNLYDGKMGNCWKYDDGNRNIKVDRKKWDAASDIGRKVLVFHELGHCALDRHHRCSMWGEYQSLMNPNFLLNGLLTQPLTKNPKDYWEESLFNYLELELFDSQYLYLEDC